MSSYSPPQENVPVFDNLLFKSGTLTITQDEADKRYLRFPIAQGFETLQSIVVSGEQTVNGMVTMAQNLIMKGTALTNYIQFPDGTKQYTASSAIGSSGVSIVTYTTSQTITPPTGTFKMDVILIGSGGIAGATTNVPNTPAVIYGGSGASGNMASAIGIPWKTNTLTLSFNGSATVLTFASLGTATVY